MAGKHGGKRAGSGPKPRPTPDLPAAPQSYTAEAYLRAVVEGREPAEPNRIAAARSLLRFEAPITRLPPPAPAAKELQQRANTADEQRRLKEWDEKAARIKAEHYAKHPKKE